MSFLAEMKVFVLPKPKVIRKPYFWIIDPSLRYLRQDCELSAPTIDRARTWVGDFLDALGKNVTRKDLKKLTAEKVDHYIQRHLKDEPERRSAL